MRSPAGDAAHAERIANLIVAREGCAG